MLCAPWRTCNGAISNAFVQRLICWPRIPGLPTALPFREKPGSTGCVWGITASFMWCSIGCWWCRWCELAIGGRPTADSALIRRTNHIFIGRLILLLYHTHAKMSWHYDPCCKHPHSRTDEYRHSARLLVEKWKNASGDTGSVENTHVSTVQSPKPIAMHALWRNLLACYRLHRPTTAATAERIPDPPIRR